MWRKWRCCGDSYASTARETVALVTSLPPSELDVAAWLAANRDAWGIENGLQQRLDQSQREDESRVRTPRSLRVLGMLRRFSVSIGMHWRRRQKKPHQKTMTDFLTAMDAEHHRYAPCALRPPQPSKPLHEYAMPIQTVVSFVVAGFANVLYFVAMADTLRKLSILIPVYNEQNTIAEILRRVRAANVLGLATEIIVVNDASTDGTARVLAELPAASDLKIVSHPLNRGKGAAIRTALAQATGDIVLIQDADLEYDPSDYPILLKPILDGRADVVYGSRFLGGPHRVLLFWHFAANKFLTLLCNMLCNLNLSDMETGYKVFQRKCLEGVTLNANRFGIEPELTAKLARRRCRFYEAPISYSGRDYREGKKIGWKDGVAALWFIFRYRFFN